MTVVGSLLLAAGLVVAWLSRDLQSRDGDVSGLLMGAGLMWLGVCVLYPPPARYQVEINPMGLGHWTPVFRHRWRWTAARRAARMQKAFACETRVTRV